MILDTKTLAKILAEELDKDGWGDISPYWIEFISEGWTEDPENKEDDNFEETQNLKEVLDRVVQRLNALQKE